MWRAAQSWLTRIDRFADTLALMMPLNNQLMKAEALRKDPEWKRSRLAEWASLHAVRTAVRFLSVICRGARG